MFAKEKFIENGKMKSKTLKKQPKKSMNFEKKPHIKKT